MGMKTKLKHIAVITAVLLALTLFPGLSVYAGISDKDQGYKDGYNTGYTDGLEAAWTDLDEGNRKSYSKAIPTNSEIKDYYELDKENHDYEDAFLDGYRDGFREGYEFGYENPDSGAGAQVAYDEELGYSMGEIKGKIDYYAGRDNAWNLTVPTTTSIIQIFGLSKESEAYKNDFVSNFRTFYKKGYEYGYRSAKFSPMQNDIAQGTKDGEQFGGILGSNYGRIDFYNNYDIEWDRNLPMDNEIEGIFLLTKDIDNYRYAFLSAFKTAYRTKYEEAYRKANVDKNLLLFEQGYEHGKAIGVLKGESLAKLDRIMNVTNNDTRNNYSDKDIIKEYMLFNEDEKYREGFISGYREGRKEGYITSYQGSNYEYGISKVVTEVVPISGVKLNSGDHKMLLTIEKGIFYNEIVVSIDKSVDNNATVKLPSKDSMTKASDFYTVGVSNYSANVNPDKAVELSFEYYGPENGGIYKYTNGGWVYMPSKIDASKISTKISARSINKSIGTYAVFIDANAWNPYDLRGNWAKDEIVAYLRRGLAGVYSDSTFRPDFALTQGQAVSWINKVYKKQLAEPKAPNTPMTYTMLEGLMKQATGDKNFTWAFIAEKIATNKDKRSNSYSSMNKYITRAEAIYMLYYLNQ